MDTGEVAYIIGRLFLGAFASFFAILLWSRTRDIAWMLMVIGTIASYTETVYDILNTFGITGAWGPTIGSKTLLSIILPNLPTVFYIIAFAVMVIRKSRRR